MTEPTYQPYDEYLMHMPSGKRMYLKVATPLTVADRDWLHALVDLILVEEPATEPEHNQP